MSTTLYGENYLLYGLEKRYYYVGKNAHRTDSRVILNSSQIMVSLKFFSQNYKGIWLNGD